MIYKSISIENFKGIKEIKIDFSNNRIVTLVGLNESGKTTILEGMQLYYKLCTGEEQLKSNDYLKIRPKGIAFTGEIKISAELEFEENDYILMKAFIKKEGHTSRINFPSDFRYSYHFDYELHTYQETRTTSKFDAKSKAAKGSLYESNNELWNKLVNHVKSNLIPDILYYEDFIFEIPDSIPFLFEDGETELIKKQDDKISEWKLVLDDILKSISPGFTSFKKNVVDIWKSDNDTARQRISAMEQKLDSVITIAWQELFEKTAYKSARRLNFKEIKIICAADEAGIGISFKIKSDSGKEFSINERSKGFKWFFSFLIFTEFRKNRNNNILFLLDEPASNLHSSAQIKILNAIKELSDRSMVVYSTHSHHLINPLWLNGAYVVINEGISQENLEGALTDTEAKIRIDKYYNFINTSSDSSNSIFFQPILDRLDYKMSSLELKSNITICEGKFDWYTFKYIFEVILEDSFEFNFYPGKGKDNLLEIIKLYLSWGTGFLVIMDGDEASQKAAKNYRSELVPFLDDKIYTYNEILNLQAPTEDIFSEVDKKTICDTAFGEGTYDSSITNYKKFKSKFNFSIIQLLTKGLKVSLEKETIKKFNVIAEFIKSKK